MPWTELKEHLLASFLHVDEASALRDEVEKTSQSAYEPEEGYNRRFREVADAAYPVTLRNDDQHRILIRAYQSKGSESNTSPPPPLYTCHHFFSHTRLEV